MPDLTHAHGSAKDARMNKSVDYQRNVLKKPFALDGGRVGMGVFAEEVTGRLY